MGAPKFESKTPRQLRSPRILTAFILDMNGFGCLSGINSPRHFSPTATWSSAQVLSILDIFSVRCRTQDPFFQEATCFGMKTQVYVRYRTEGRILKG